MSKRLKGIGLALCVALSGSLSAQLKYEPNWESLKQHTPVPEWMRDAKFGIYCHRGVYSVPAYDNEQYYCFMHRDDTYDKMGTCRRRVELYEPLSEFGLNSL